MTRAATLPAEPSLSTSIDVTEDALAQAVLATGTTAAGQVRAERFQALLRSLFGEGGPTANAHRSEPMAHFPTLAPSARHRAEAEAVARVVIRSFLSLDLARLAPHLAGRVFMLWPDGTLAWHDPEPLLTALAARAVGPVQAIPGEPAAHVWAGLRLEIPAPVAASFEETLGMAGTLVYATSLASPKGPLGRVMVVMGLDRDGRWRARTLPLPAIDAAAAASAPPSADEEDWVRFADRLARPILNHGAGALRALRNHMMDRILVDGEAMDAEVMIRRLERSPPPAERLDLSFLGTRSENLEALDEAVGHPVTRDLGRNAESLWRQKLDSLRPKLAITELGQLAPKSQQPKPCGRLISLMVRRVEQDQRNEERIHWRLAALWCPLAGPVMPGSQAGRTR